MISPRSSRVNDDGPIETSYHVTGKEPGLPGRRVLHNPVDGKPVVALAEQSFDGTVSSR